MKNELQDLLEAEEKLTASIHDDYLKFRLLSLGRLQTHSSKLITLSEKCRIRVKKIVVQIDNYFLSQAFLTPTSDRLMLAQMRHESYLHKHTVLAQSLETKRPLQSQALSHKNSIILSRLELTPDVVEALLRSHYGKDRDRLFIQRNDLPRLKRQYLSTNPEWAKLYKEWDGLKRLYKEINQVNDVSPNFLNITLNQGEN